jgi:hypothetical protein
MSRPHRIERSSNRIGTVDCVDSRELRNMVSGLDTEDNPELITWESDDTACRLGFRRHKYVFELK